MKHVFMTVGRQRLHYFAILSACVSWALVAGPAWAQVLAFPVDALVEANVDPKAPIGAAVPEYRAAASQLPANDPGLIERDVSESLLPPTDAPSAVDLPSPSFPQLLESGDVQTLPPPDDQAEVTVPTAESGLGFVDVTEMVMADDAMIVTETDDDFGGGERPMILFQPAVPAFDQRGQSILRPTVQIADEVVTEVLPTPLSAEALPKLDDARYREGRLRLADVIESPSDWRDYLSGQRWQKFRHRYQRGVSRLADGIRFLATTHRAYDCGVGVERLPFALFEIDAAQPSNNFRLRFEAGYDWEAPDRAEYFWSKLGGKGPPLTVPVESSVDYQDVRIAMEVGGEKFSATTEIPLHFVDPTVLGNTGGMGDMVLTTKTVMLSGDKLQITQVLRNQLATGSAKKGRGVGHASMEPGFVVGYRRQPNSMWHSELKLWFPIAGDPDHSGPVLRYGLGYAKLWYDSDTLAIIPTLEFVGWSVLTGGQTVPGPLLGTAEIQSIDGLNIFNLYPGIRLAKDTGGDLGMFELGFSGGVSVSEHHWYDSMVRMDLRWTF